MLSSIGLAYLENVPLVTLDIGFYNEVYYQDDSKNSTIMSALNKLGKTLRNLRVTNVNFSMAPTLYLPNMQTDRQRLFFIPATSFWQILNAGYY